MRRGDVVICCNTGGYAFTEGKEYTVLEYQSKKSQNNFSWPDYIRVVDDNNRHVFCHMNKFTLKE